MLKTKEELTKLESNTFYDEGRYVIAYEDEGEENREIRMIFNEEDFNQVIDEYKDIYENVEVFSVAYADYHGIGYPDMTENEYLEWNNYGDINPIEHGGIFIKKSYDDPGDNSYDVVTINRVSNADQTLDENMWVLSNMHFDMDNLDWVDWKAVCDSTEIGKDNREIDQIIALWYYYGTDEFGVTEVIEGEKNVIKELATFDIQI